MDRLIQLTNEAWALSDRILTRYVPCEDDQAERLKRIHKRVMARYLRRHIAVNTLAMNEFYIGEA